jgi:hypothetical protein
MVEMWYEREIHTKISGLAAQFPALVLTGARQTGKTSLLRRMFPDHNYVSLDIPSVAARAEESPAEFLDEFAPPVLIDEVQYAPKLFRHLKIAIDARRHLHGQFILTGSQKFHLMREISDSLAGRIAILELETLSASETDQEKENTVSQHVRNIVRGGYPDLWRVPTLLPNDFFGSYLSSYLERDVRQLINVVSLRSFETFVRVCAARTSQVLDKTAIANEVGVRSKTINDWISVLCASNIISLLEPWFGNFGKRLIKSPKLYFCDTGLASYLLGITEKSLAQSPFLGAMWETFVYAELRKRMMLLDQPKSIWFYRDNDQREIDFLLLGGEKNLAVECKWHEIPADADARSMVELRDYLQKNPRDELANLQPRIVCRTPHDHPLGNNVLGVNLPSLKNELLKLLHRAA